MKFNKKAFTLAETIITLIILGIVAVIAIPSFYNKYTESHNKTKLKKAMAIYESALRVMMAEHNINSNNALANFANGCTNTSPYFSPVKILNNNSCTFKTTDGIYWDISDIQKVVVSFKERDLSAANADVYTKKAFYLMSIFVNGQLRINEIAYLDDDGKVALSRLYDFLNINKNGNYSENKNPVSDEGVCDNANDCANVNENPNQKEDEIVCDGSRDCLSKGKYNGDCEGSNVSCKTCSGSSCTYYDDSGILVAKKLGCDEQGDNCVTISTFDSEGRTTSFKTPQYEIENFVYGEDKNTCSLTISSSIVTRTNDSSCYSSAQCNAQPVCNVFNEKGERTLRLECTKPSSGNPLDVLTCNKNIRILKPDGKTKLVELSNCNYITGKCNKCSTFNGGNCSDYCDENMVCRDIHTKI